MKQVLVVALLFLATLGISLWALGVFEGSRPETEPAPPPKEGPSPTPGQLPPAEPKDEPAPEFPMIEDPIRVLGVVQAPRSFTQWLYGFWDDVPAVSYQVWATEKGAGIPTPALSKGLPRLEAPPTIGDLERADVLLLDDVDPSKMPPEFWARAAERVKAGSMGLLVIPGVGNGVEMAEEQSLSTVIPAKALPVAPPARGSRDVAGVFPEERSFAVTAEGRAHPASRLSSWPNWSGWIWEALATGPWKWGTKFVHPAEPKPGSQVLLEVRLGGDRTAPAIVASGPASGSDGSVATGGRVLWVGLFDLGDAAYRGKGDTPQARERSFKAIKSLSAYWLAWLAKRA